MTRSLTSLLDQAEKSWLSVLFNWSARHFEGSWLPSHDQNHHFRVWVYAKQLLQAASNNGFRPTDEFVKQLMLAVFFHDAGMTKTLASEHGTISSGFCRDFIQAGKLLAPSALEETVQAIKNHEDKNYLSLDNNRLSLLTFLNLADDLDAFGYIGVYRYAEINLLREIKPDRLPEHVLANLDRRFSHMLQRFPSNNPMLLNQASERYENIRNFFHEANQKEKDDLSALEKDASKRSQAVLQMIRQQVILEKIHPLHLASVARTPAVQQWWIAFNNEWNAFQYPKHE